MQMTEASVRTSTPRLVETARERVPSTRAAKSISVIGLGYVGAVSVACLARVGHRMIGVDVSLDRVRAVKEGRSPIVEDKLGDYLKAGVAAGRIDATQNLVAAILDSTITLLSVGTPTAPDGSCDLTYARQASRSIGQALAMKASFHVVVLRCSVPPGTTLDVVAHEIAATSGKTLGRDFGVCFNPEFLREGVAVEDFFSPPKTVIGASDPRTEEIVRGLFAEIDPNVLSTTIPAAEMIKYVDNVWHATKVAFGNEVGRLCKSLSIDSHEVMNIFIQDKKLNLSPYYLKPGFAFGGSCLPKEVRAVGHLAEALSVDLPLVKSLSHTNDLHIEAAARQLAPFSGRRIGLLGLTFKADTDDIRESPALALLARLDQRGEQVRFYDRNVAANANLASQLAYVRHAAPEQIAVMEKLPMLQETDLDRLLADCDVLVVCHATAEFRKAVTSRRPGVNVLDLVRLFPDLPDDATYQGIAW